MNFEVAHKAFKDPIAVNPVTAKPAAAKARNWSLPGVCGQANVTTSFGNLPVQVLRQFDPLRTTDGQIHRVAWIDKIQLDEAFLKDYPDAQPIHISAGALGPNMPAKDILVSPHQKVAVRGGGFELEMRLARDLLGRPGVMRKPQETVTYYLFHCGQPAKIAVEGAVLHTAP